MKSRLFRLFAATFLAILVTAPHTGSCQDEKSNPSDEALELMQKMAPYQADSCDGPDSSGQDAWLYELPFLPVAAKVALQELNRPGSELISPHDRAKQALDKLVKESSEINKSWEADDRFHYQILDLPPVLVVKVGIGTLERYFTFAVPPGETGKPSREWQSVGDDTVEGQGPPRTSVRLFPLHRGPSGNARFLAEIESSGCAGSVGRTYEAREWDVNGTNASGYIDTVIKVEGSMGMDEDANGNKPTRKNPFAPIGRLETTGKLITLPYCWFSSIDTWDNPSLCALDTYDLSRDEVRFVSRTWNRPDLVPIAKAIEHATQHELPAVQAYCANADIARRLFRDIPQSVFADDLQVKRIAEDKEHVEFGSRTTYRFDMEKHGGLWLIAAFSEQ